MVMSYFEVMCRYTKIAIIQSFEGIIFCIHNLQISMSHVPIFIPYLHLLETDRSKLEKSDDTIKGVNCLVVYCRAFIVKLGCPEFRSLVKLICTHC